MTITRHTPFDDLPEFLTPEEYQAFFDISRAAAYAHIRTGKIQARRFGRLLRIPKAALIPEPEVQTA